MSELSRIPKLTSLRDVRAWKEATNAYFRTKGLSSIIDGTEKEPSTASSDDAAETQRTTRAGSVMPEFSGSTTAKQASKDEWKEWCKREEMAQGVILQTITDDLYQDCQELHTAAEMWTYLTELFSLHSEETSELTRIAERDLRAMRLRGQPTADEMIDHVTKFNKTWADAKRYDSRLIEIDRCDLFILSLPRHDQQIGNEYRDFRKALSKQPPPRWLDCMKIFNKLVAEKDVEEAHDRVDDVMVASVQRDQHAGREYVRETRTCYRCDKKGHIGRDCKNPKKMPKPKGGGTVEKEAVDGNGKPRFRGALIVTKAQESEEEVSNPFVGGDATTGLYHLRTGALNDIHSVMVDSGAEQHITSHRDLLSSFVTGQNLGNVIVPGAHRFSVTGSGTLTLLDDEGREHSFKNVFYVPGAGGSFFSRGQLEEDGWKVDYENDVMIGKGGAYIAMFRVGRLHYVSAYFGTCQLNFIGGGNAVYEEHVRLGHINGRKLLLLSQLGYTQVPLDAKQVKDFRMTDCPACSEHKAARRPKNRQSSRARAPGEMIHMDIVGPFTKSKSGNTYALVLIEDFSKISQVLPLPGKTNILQHIQAFVARIERQCGTRVRFLRSDNGSEFLSNEAQAWYQRVGLIHQRSTRYTPELNGVCERYIRTLKETTSAMLSSAKLGNQYWDYAIRYASCVLMKITMGDDRISAWERYTGRDKNVKEIRAFGEYCYVQIPQETRLKDRLNTKKAVLGRVLGLDIGKSGWMVRVETSGELVHSRDVQKATGEHYRLDEEIGTPSPFPLQATIDEVDEESEKGENDVAEETRGGGEAMENEGGDTEKSKLRMTEVLELGSEISSDDGDNISLTSPAPEIFTGAISFDDVRDQLNYYGKDARWHYLGSEYVLNAITKAPDDVPATINEALNGEESEAWQKAMKTELSTIEEKDVWEETVLPKGRKVVGSRWVLAKKKDANGNVLKYKARLVAQGFSQQPGVDYELTWSPTSRFTSLRLILIIAAKDDLEIGQADVKGAYLNGRLDEPIFMRYPKGMTPSKGCNVLRLKGSLYGLKQSGRIWWIQLRDVLLGLGFQRVGSDWGLYVRHKSGSRKPTIILSYVDDLIIVAPEKKEIDGIFGALGKEWDITTTEEVTQVLGIKIARNRSAKTFHISLPKNIDELTERFPTDLRKQNVPLNPRSLARGQHEDESPAAPLTPYQEIVGSLQWIASTVRADIAFSAAYLARFASKPLESHWQLALRVTAYLGQTKHEGLVLGGDGTAEALEGWVDADLAGCLDTRRSTSGYVFKAYGSVVDWQSKRQAVTATSTLESELMEDLGFELPPNTRINCDNQGALALATNPGAHHRTKHIDIRIHMIRDYVEVGLIRLEYVRSKSNIADILTKALEPILHVANVRGLRIRAE
ncbi:hypothetical protein B9479_006854 [Cryptococcus floricola]|uniref:Integrase catalytic domain-containing protein n=1 Tax=Cryptococcus floricola TaxID=2591691 RepID=A0A5D3AR30_9TREE|nr:hypothetical protein B9479_006854 [Cryptococcus floricola]